MSKNQNRLPKTAATRQPSLLLWQELDDEQAEKLSGGEFEGELAWSIGFADVVRPTSSTASNTVTPTTGKIRVTLSLP